MRRRRGLAVMGTVTGVALLANLRLTGAGGSASTRLLRFRPIDSVVSRMIG